MGRDPSEQELQVFLIEDNPGDIRLTEEAFAEADFPIELHSVLKGTKALDYLNNREGFAETPTPDLTLLDLNLPRMSGFDVLQEIRNTPELQSLPVIILTDSDTQETIDKGYQESANAFLTKPVTVEEFVEMAQSIGDFWFRRAEFPDV